MPHAAVVDLSKGIVIKNKLIRKLVGQCCASHLIYFVTFYYYYFISGAEKTDFLKFSLELVHKLQKSDALEVCWLPKKNLNILF